MEVHHHPHVPHGKKKLKEYFLEFLMIFLAVTMGFFAEGLRERLSEKKLEREFMNSMYSDLKADTLSINEIIKTNNFRILSSDSLINILAQSKYDQTDLKKIYRIAFCNMSDDHMAFHKTALTEMKNNAATRFIHNRKILKQITQYELDINTIEEQGKTAGDFSLKNIEFGNRMLNYRYISKDGTMSSHQKKEKYTGDYQLLISDPIQMKRYSNLVFMQAGIIATYSDMIIEQKKEAIKLIKAIKDAYPVKDEKE